MKTCPQCHGEKMIPRDDNGGRRFDREPCPNCRGLGQVSEMNLKRWENDKNGDA